MKSIHLWIALVFVLSALTFGEKELICHEQGAVSLSGPGDYDWWHGCSPTSAGMMMGYYDLHGYGNMVPNADAENHTFGSGPYAANDIIASSGHINDFYRNGYLGSGDDLAGAPTHSFNCLADFMGTSQDAYGNANGSTTFWNYTDGSRLYDWQIYGYGPSYYGDSGMYGLREFVEYRGYQTATLFNQYIYGHNGNTLGFTFDAYIAEIDAGRPVMIHVDGHSMYGYGYDAATSEVLLHDTWSLGEKRMVWGGSYSGLAHYGITAMELVIPEPAAMSLLALGGLALTRKRN